MGIIFLLLRCLCGDFELPAFFRKLKQSFNRRRARVRRNKCLFTYKLVLVDDEIHGCGEFNPGHLTSSARFARGPPAELSTLRPTPFVVLGAPFL